MNKLEKLLQKADRRRSGKGIGEKRRKIEEALKSTLTQAEIARAFGVSRQYVNAVKSRSDTAS